ncbi:hypothetical protein Tco_0511081 [Tanacetum coccineum]
MALQSQPDVLASSRLMKISTCDSQKRLEAILFLLLSLFEQQCLSSISWHTSHIHPSLSKEILHYYLRQWLCDIVGIAIETVCFVRFESLEIQMLVQRLTQRTQVQMLIGKRMFVMVMA